MSDNITNRNGGVDFNAAANIGGDAVGHDKNVVETGGGAHIDGNVEVSGGKVVGRDDHSTNIYEAPAPIVLNLHQLPAPPADFTGRAAELDAILKDLQHGAVITGIRGLGGIGKTALALVIADQLKAQYPDAQFFINLQGASDRPLAARDALAHVVRGFHPIEKLPDDEAGLRAQYLSDLHDKRAIILLDDARDAEQVKPLLPPSSCLLLITSRQHFHLPGLHPTDLDTLPPEDARKLLVEIAPRLANIILSAEGARNLLTDHPEILRRLTTAQTDTVQMVDIITYLCGYLPLALRVGGSFLAERPDFDVNLYVRRLSENRLKQLGDVNSTLQVSYDLLPPELQRLWRQLAVFPADFDRAAAEFVWDIDEDTAQDVLSELVRYSLVEYKTRYHLHDLARLFADTRLSEDERHAAQRRHAEYYNIVLSAANDLYLQGNENIARGPSLFDTEWSNIQAGQTWVVAHVGEDKAIAQLCSIYAGYGSIQNLRLHPLEWIQWTEKGLEGARSTNNRMHEGILLENLGNAYSKLGETRKAIEFYEQHLGIARELGDRHGEGGALGNLGTAYYSLGEMRKAIEFYTQQLKIMHEINTTSHSEAQWTSARRGEGAALGNLGIAYAALGETRKAIGFYEQHRDIVREIGDRCGEGNALGNLGIAYAALGETRKAIEFCEQQRVIAHELGDRHGEGYALGNLGVAYSILGDMRKAIEFYKQALQIKRETGDKRGEGNSLWNMALALDKLSERDQTIAHAEAALKIFEQIEDPHAEMARQQLAKWKGV